MFIQQFTFIQVKLIWEIHSPEIRSMLTNMIPSSVLIAPMKEKILCIPYRNSLFRKPEWKTIRVYSVYKTSFFFNSDKVRKLNSQGFMDIFIWKLFNFVYFVKYLMLFCLTTMQRLIQEKARSVI